MVLLIFRLPGQLFESYPFFCLVSDGTEEPERDGRDNGSPDISSDGLKNVNSEDGLIIKATNKSNCAEDVDIEEYILQGAVPKHLTEGEFKSPIFIGQSIHLVK